MTIQEILEAHLRVMGQRGTGVLCICGWHTIALGKRSEDLHRAHVAEVLNKYMQERCYEAWSAGWHDSHYQHTAHNEHRGHAHPEVGYSNPYRKDTANGR